MERINRAARVLGLIPSASTVRTIWQTGVWLCVLAQVLTGAAQVQAAGALNHASVLLSDSRPSQTGTSYTFTGSGVDGGTAILCVKQVWATSSVNDIAPGGFSGASGSVTAASSTLINSSATGWSLAKSDGTSSSGQNNIYKYTNSTGVTPSTTSGATFVTAGLTNPSLADTPYYLQLSTYGNTDCASSPIDHATVEFINTNSQLLSLTVDPSLTFTVGGMSSSASCDTDTTTVATTSTTIPFGTLTSSANGLACQDLAASTNAANGFTIYVRETGPLSNGTHSFADTSGSNTSPAAFSGPGTEAYGYSTDDASLGTGTADRFTNPSQQYAAITTSNAEVAYEAAGVNTTHYHIAHQAGVSTTTPTGTYTTTIIYTCTPIY